MCPTVFAVTKCPEAVERGGVGLGGAYLAVHTNVATKPMIIATLVKVIREGLYIERDEACLDEYLAYERRQNGSFGAIAGCHDDLLMTRAIGLHICFRELDAPRRVPAAAPYPCQTRTAPSGFAAW